jgi:hypothetical protein
MRRGRVSARWARVKRPRWFEAETGEPAHRLRSPEPVAPAPPSS